MSLRINLRQIEVGCGVLVVCSILVPIVVGPCLLFPGPTTGIWWYKNCRGYMGPLAAHFPESRPSRTTEPIMYYHPGGWQSGPFFQLRVRLSPEGIETLRKQLEKDAVHVFKGGGSQFRHYADEDDEFPSQENEVPTTSFRVRRPTGDPEIYGFPKHFSMFVLIANDGGAWNHGETAGVALSAQTNEAVYWADDW